MLKLNVLELLKRKGKTKYYLFSQLNMTYTNFNNIVTNKTRSIRYENIEKFCKILECTPNELFIEVPDEECDENDDDLDYDEVSKVKVKSTTTAKSKNKAKAKPKTETSK